MQMILSLLTNMQFCLSQLGLGKYVHFRDSYKRHSLVFSMEKMESISGKILAMSGGGESTLGELYYMEKMNSES